MMEWIRKHDILTRVLSVLVAMMLWLAGAYFFCLKKLPAVE